MKGNILVKNVQQLSKKQWVSFLQFIRSPYFNQNVKVIQLAEYLQKNSDNWADAKLDRNYLFEHFFPKKTFRFQLLKDLFSNLQKQLRLFLAIENFSEKPYIVQAAIAEGALQNGMEQLWKQQHKQLLSSYTSNESNAFLPISVLEIEKNHILKSGDRRKAEEVLDRQIKELDLYYWHKRLRLAIERKSIRQVLNLENPILESDLLLRLPNSLKGYLSIEIYSLIYKILDLPFPENETYFQSLLLKLEENHFPGCYEEEIYSFYVYALNYCTGRINAGISAYYQNLFRVYELLDLHNRLIRDKSLSQWTFLNIVTTACNLGKFTWAEKFIHNNHIYISALHQNNALYHNLALLAFYQNNYEKALEYLPKVTFSDPYYALNGRMLQLRVFFEMKEWLLLDALLERVRIYLLRDKTLPKSRKKESQNFLKSIKLLALYKQTPQSSVHYKKNISVFVQKVQQTQPMMHSKWLLKKANELLK